MTPARRAERRGSRVSEKSCTPPGANGAVDDEKDLALARKALDDLRAEARRPMNPRMSTLAVDGSPAEEIISRARAFQMIVMGTHGRTGLRHLLMGSVAEAVVRGAPCPVVTIHFPSPDGTPLAATTENCAE